MKLHSEFSRELFAISRKLCQAQMQSKAVRAFKKLLATAIINAKPLHAPAEILPLPAPEREMQGILVRPL